ncbi:MAG: hypothetical protein ACTSRP_01275 [Candidatus Helarchaeota archaeon]
MYQINSKKFNLITIFNRLLNESTEDNYRFLKKNPYFYYIYRKTENELNFIPFTIQDCYNNLFFELIHRTDFKQIEFDLNYYLDIIRFLDYFKKLDRSSLINFISILTPNINENRNINPKIILKYCKILETIDYSNEMIDNLIDNIYIYCKRKIKSVINYNNMTKSKIFNNLYYLFILDSIDKIKGSNNLVNYSEIFSNILDYIYSNNWLELEFFEVISFYDNTQKINLFSKRDLFKKNIKSQLQMFLENYFLYHSINFDEFLLFWNILIHNSIYKIIYKIETTPGFTNNQQNELYLIEPDIINILPKKIRKTAYTVNALIESKIIEPIPVMLRKLIQNILFDGIRKITKNNNINRNLNSLFNKAEQLKLLSPQTKKNLQNIKYLGDIEAHNIFFDENIRYVKEDLRNICIFINTFYNRLKDLINKST